MAKISEDCCALNIDRNVTILRVVMKVRMLLGMRVVLSVDLVIPVECWIRSVMEVLVGDFSAVV